MRETGNAYKSLVGEHERRHYLEDLGLDGTIICEHASSIGYESAY
jgi:hypothetical protein